MDASMRLLAGVWTRVRQSYTRVQVKKIIVSFLAVEVLICLQILFDGLDFYTESLGFTRTLEFWVDVCVPHTTLKGLQEVS